MGGWGDWYDCRVTGWCALKSLWSIRQQRVACEQYYSLAIISHQLSSCSVVCARHETFFLFTFSMQTPFRMRPEMRGDACWCLVMRDVTWPWHLCAGTIAQLLSSFGRKCVDVRIYCVRVRTSACQVRISCPALHYRIFVEIVTSAFSYLRVDRW